MRDDQIYQAINAGLTKIAQQASGTFVRMAREIDELRDHMTSEALRREAFEEYVLKSMPEGSPSAGTYDSRVAELDAIFKLRVEAYKKEVEEAMKAAEAAAKEAAKVEPEAPRRTIYGPDGVTPLEAAGNGRP